MPSIIAGATVAAGVGSSLIGASAAKGAAKAQGRAADRASAQELAIYNQNRTDMSPFMSVGTGAISQLAQMFGLAPPTISPNATINGGDPMTTAANGGVTDAQMTQLLKDRPDVMQAWNLAVNGGVAPDGTIVKPADRHSPAFAQAGLGSPQEYARNWYLNKGGSTDYQMPGAPAAATSPLLDPASGATPMPGAAGSDLSKLLQSFPGYQFGRDQGVQALDRSAASRGLALSGGQMKDVATFGTNYAMQQAWNPYISELNSMAGLGENAAAGVGNNGVNVGNSVGNNIMSGGEAAASGIVGSANNIGDALKAGAQGLAAYNSPYSNGYNNPYGNVGGGLNLTDVPVYTSGGGGIDRAIPTYNI